MRTALAVAAVVLGGPVSRVACRVRGHDPVHLVDGTTLCRRCTRSI